MKPDIEKIKSVALSSALDAVIDGSQASRWLATRENLLHHMPDKPFVAPRVLAAMARLLEGFLVAIVAFANLARYPGIENMNDPWLYLTVSIVAAFVFPTLLQLSGTYRLNNLLNPLPSLTSFVASWLLLFAGITLFAFVGFFMSMVYWLPRLGSRRL